VVIESRSHHGKSLIGLPVERKAAAKAESTPKHVSVIRSVVTFFILSAASNQSVGSRIGSGYQSSKRTRYAQ
jgi:hypothetical protein